MHGLHKLTSFGNSEVREGCQFGKADCLPFDKSYSKCKTLLELFHSDVLGPCDTPSYVGFRHVVLFADDFTRYTWVYFVKEKSDVFS